MPGPEDSGFTVLPLMVAAAFGYLLGALPFGYLVARSHGVNIFEHGSKSPGATNISRVVGRGAGNLVFVLDALKGAVAAGGPMLVGLHSGQPHSANLLGFVGLAFALLGHSFSCFTGFRGGKGVSTAAGGLLVLLPVVTAVAAGVWALVFLATRFSSVASMTAALSLPVSALLLPGQGGTIPVAVTVAVALFVVVRHRANIARLLNGTEKRFERTKPPGRGKA
jgi:glycerol-3-phosphate acyltransferase PlsY